MNLYSPQPEHAQLNTITPKSGGLSSQSHSHSNSTTPRFSAGYCLPVPNVLVNGASIGGANTTVSNEHLVPSPPLSPKIVPITLESTRRVSLPSIASLIDKHPLDEPNDAIKVRQSWPTGMTVRDYTDNNLKFLSQYAAFKEKGKVGRYPASYSVQQSYYPSSMPAATSYGAGFKSPKKGLDSQISRSRFSSPNRRYTAIVKNTNNVTSPTFNYAGLSPYSALHQEYIYDFQSRLHNKQPLKIKSKQNQKQSKRQHNTSGSSTTRRFERKSNPAAIPPLASAEIVSKIPQYVPHVSWQQLPDYSPPLSTIPDNKFCMKVEWKGTPMDLSKDPLRDKLHPAELVLAQILRLPCDLYLDSKRRFFLEKLYRVKKGKTFRRTDAQKSCRIDVNKASRLFQAFEKVGWLDDKYFTKNL